MFWKLALFDVLPVIKTFDFIILLRIRIINSKYMYLDFSDWVIIFQVNPAKKPRVTKEEEKFRNKNYSG